MFAMVWVFLMIWQSALELFGVGFLRFQRDLEKQCGLRFEMILCLWFVVIGNFWTVHSSRAKMVQLFERKKIPKLPKSGPVSPFNAKRCKKHLEKSLLYIKRPQFYSHPNQSTPRATDQFDPPQSPPWSPSHPGKPLLRSLCAAATEQPRSARPPSASIRLATHTFQKETKMTSQRYCAVWWWLQNSRSLNESTRNATEQQESHWHSPACFGTSSAANASSSVTRCLVARLRPRQRPPGNRHQ